jgi:carbamoyl-phosphate synthase large subunit
MVSTGEVACLGDDFNEAFLKSLLSVGFRVPPKNGAILLSTGPIDSKAELLKSMQALSSLGYQLYATEGTARFLAAHGLESTILHWPLTVEKMPMREVDGEGEAEIPKEPNTLTYIMNGAIDLVINIPKNIETEELDNDYLIRRKAVDCDVPLITNLQLAKRFVEAISALATDELKTKAWKEYLHG